PGPDGTKGREETRMNKRSGAREICRVISAWWSATGAYRAPTLCHASQVTMSIDNGRAPQITCEYRRHRDWRCRDCTALWPLRANSLALDQGGRLSSSNAAEWPYVHLGDVD